MNQPQRGERKSFFVSLSARRRADKKCLFPPLQTPHSRLNRQLRTEMYLDILFLNFLLLVQVFFL